MNVKKLVTDAMLAAMCAVLGYVAIDLGNIKIAFDSFPVLLAAIALGPLDGLAVGTVGALIYQVLRYGISATTVLWILPYSLCGLFVGLYLRKYGGEPDRKHIIIGVVIGEAIFFILNTLTLYIDSKIYGYYYPAFIVGSIGVRFLIFAGKAVAFSLIMPGVLRAVKKVLGEKKTDDG